MVKKAAKTTPGGGGRKPGGNPPKEFQFKKGSSGNNAGRPAGSKNFKTIVLEAAADHVMATVNGKTRKMSKVQAAVMQLATKAANGDHKAMSKFLELVDNMEMRASSSRPAQFPFGESDLRVLHEIYERLKLCNPEKLIT